jgi:hypothetical protein
MSENIIVDPEAEDQKPQIEEESPVEDKIPPKFRGKGPDEIIRAYEELESEFGRKNNEIGQLRRLTDQLLGLEEAKQRKAQAEAKPATKITSDSLFEDPDKSITEKAREIAEERARVTDERVMAIESRLREEAFERKHSGFKETLQTPEFIEFVRASPYRQRLIQQAAMDDWEAADELFTAWEEGQSNRAPPESPAKQAKKSTLVKSGGSSAAGVVPRDSGKKTYSRSELIEMRIKNPEEFDERFQSEFLPAYLEGRVK